MHHSSFTAAFVSRTNKDGMGVEITCVCACVPQGSPVNPIPSALFPPFTEHKKNAEQGGTAVYSKPQLNEKQRSFWIYYDFFLGLDTETKYMISI